MSIKDLSSILLFLAPQGVMYVTLVLTRGQRRRIHGAKLNTAAMSSQLFLSQLWLFPEQVTRTQPR